MNLSVEQFSKIIVNKSKLLSEVEGAISNEALIELTKKSGQSRWLIAFHLLIIGNFGKPTIDNIFNSEKSYGLNELFVKYFSEYTGIITKNDRDALVEILKGLPVVFRVAIGKNLFNSAIRMFKIKDLGGVQKNNMKIVTTIFEDPKLAKSIVSEMS